LPVSLIVFVERLDHTTPRLALAIVDLPQIKHWPLHHLAASATLALYNTPVAVLFAVFDPSCESQVHDDGV